MREWLLLGVALAATSAVRVHQHSAQQECVDLQCPATSFDYGKKRLVNEETLSSEPCRNCQQCTAAGYSVCLRPRLLNRGRRQTASSFSTSDISTCSCAHSIPANCHNELSRTTHPANITMQLYNVCYASSLQAPGTPLAVNTKTSVIVTVEPFWEEPYWRELDLENLTLHYTHEVTVPNHCDGEVVTSETELGEPRHVCTSMTKIGMNTDEESREDYEHSDNYQYDDDLPPEVEYDRDVFAGAKIVNFFYKVNVRRPRQLRIRSNSNDPFEDLVTIVESDPLAHEMRSEIYGTGLEGTPLEHVSVHRDEIKEMSGHDVTKEPAHGNHKVEEAKELPKDTHPTTDDEEEAETEQDEEAVSEEEGDGPENVPGTDFFTNDAVKDTSEEKKEEAEEEAEAEKAAAADKESNEIDHHTDGKSTEAEDTHVLHNDDADHKDDEKMEDKEDDEAQADDEKETEKDEEEQEKDDETDGDAVKKAEEEGSEKSDGEDETESKTEDEHAHDDPEHADATTDASEKAEETTDDEESGETTEGSAKEGSAETEGDEDNDDDEENSDVVEDETVWTWFSSLFNFKENTSRLKAVFIITITACILFFVAVFIGRRYCCAKRPQKTANGVRYEAANQNSLQLVSPERMQLNQ